MKPGIMLECHGLNWCSKYEHEIDYELVHNICENPHPKGCARCPHITFRNIKFTKLHGEIKRVSFKKG